jgi:hypothetical protein
VSLVSRGTGEVRSKVVPNVTGENLRAAIAGDVEPERTLIQTDGSFRYLRIADHFAGHEHVDHEAGEYVRGDGTTNQVENYFSQLEPQSTGRTITSASRTYSATSLSSTSATRTARNGH